MGEVEGAAVRQRAQRGRGRGWAPRHISSQLLSLPGPLLTKGRPGQDHGSRQPPRRRGPLSDPVWGVPGRSLAVMCRSGVPANTSTQGEIVLSPRVNWPGLSKLEIPKLSLS